MRLCFSILESAETSHQLQKPQRFLCNRLQMKCTRAVRGCFFRSFSAIDRILFGMTEKNLVNSVRMSENIDKLILLRQVLIQL